MTKSRAPSAENPGSNRLPQTIALAGTVQFQKRDLQEVVGNADVAKSPDEKSVHDRAQQFEQLIERLRIAVYGDRAHRPFRGLDRDVTVIGAGIGIGKLAAAAMEASGRQPEVAGQVRTSMLIAAALIEGATFFALVICILLALK